MKRENIGGGKDQFFSAVRAGARKDLTADMIPGGKPPRYAAPPGSVDPSKFGQTVATCFGCEHCIFYGPKRRFAWCEKATRIYGELTGDINVREAACLHYSPRQSS